LWNSLRSEERFFGCTKATSVIPQKTGSAAGTVGERVGHGRTSEDEKARYIRRMFDTIAPRYDLINGLISGGLHRRWKQATVSSLRVPVGGRALGEIWRVLRPGGRLAVLEFSTPRNGLVRGPYDWYSFTLLPWLGRLASRHSDAYRYLPISIRHWPAQEAFAAMMTGAGFVDVRYQNLLTGVAAIHIGGRSAAVR